jgi:hypothetical protein
MEGGLYSLQTWDKTQASWNKNTQLDKDIKDGG